MWFASPCYSKFGPCISLVGPIDGSGPHADGPTLAFAASEEANEKSQEVWTRLVLGLEKVNGFGKVGWGTELLREAVSHTCSKDLESSSRA
jgi:hypothetical protein